MGCPKTGVDVRPCYRPNGRKSIKSFDYELVEVPIMKNDSLLVKRKLMGQLALAMIGVTALGETATAQPFSYTNNDLLLGFRKTGAFQETYEAVVNIGKATNYVQAAPGSSFGVPNFTLSQLTPGSFGNLNHLNWSVFGYSKTNLSSVLPGYVNNTLWLTVPRSNAAVQTAPPSRVSYSTCLSAATGMNSIGLNGAFLSSQTTSNEFNTVSYIREPVNDSRDLTAFMGGKSSSSDSTLQDAWLQNNLENSTSASFISCIISDLYEVRPLTDALGHPVTDPHTGQTSGPAYYVGYFQLCPDGTMTFVRASQSTTPPPPQLTVTKSGTTNLISFPSANGATYTLYYTNSAGLTRPVSTWPSLPAVIIGDGSVKTFTNSAPDSERYYRVGAQ